MWKCYFNTCIFCLFKTRSQYNSKCRDAEDFDPCDSQSFRTKKIAQQKCSILTVSNYRFMVRNRYSMLIL